jgi:hypothetical protein
MDVSLLEINVAFVKYFKCAFYIVCCEILLHEAIICLNFSAIQPATIIKSLNSDCCHSFNNIFQSMLTMHLISIRSDSAFYI